MGLHPNKGEEERKRGGEDSDGSTKRGWTRETQGKGDEEETRERSHALGGKVRVGECWGR